VLGIAVERSQPFRAGYVVLRLRRCGFLAVILESSIGNSQFAICKLQGSAGGAEDRSPVREHRVPGKKKPSTVGAAHASNG